MFAGTFNAGNGSLTAVINGTIYTVDKTHGNYDVLLNAFKQSDVDTFTKFYQKTKEEVKIEPIIQNTGLEFVDGRLMYMGKEVDYSYASRILAAREAGFTIDPMLAFFENLLKNTSQRSIEELPDFLMNKNLPITDDGCFLAYKSVSIDWYSKASGSLTLLQGKSSNGRIYNAVGETIECNRNEVDDERGNECSKGLHVGGLTYSGPGGWYNRTGDKVVVVKVNPKDVVSVPKDHDAQKVRVCKYEVIGEFQEALNDNHVGVEPTLAPLPVESVYTRNVDLNTLLYLDSVIFYYQGRNDNFRQIRIMIVEEIAPDYIFGTLLPGDPSYEEGNEARKFMKCNITDLKLYDSDEEDDEYYDEDDEDDEDW